VTQEEDVIGENWRTYLLQGKRTSKAWWLQSFPAVPTVQGLCLYRYSSWELVFRGSVFIDTAVGNLALKGSFYIYSASWKSVCSGSIYAVTILGN